MHVASVSFLVDWGGIFFAMWLYGTLDGRHPAPVDTVNTPLFGFHTC